MKRHIAHLLFAASAVLAQNLPTNWLPVTLCRFCRLSLRDGDHLLDLLFSLAIRGHVAARPIPAASRTSGLQFGSSAGDAGGHPLGARLGTLPGRIV